MFIGGDKTASLQTSRPSHLFCRTTAAWKGLERDECVEVFAKRYYPSLVEDGLALFFFARRCAEVVEACELCAARTKAIELSCLVLFSAWKGWCGHVPGSDFTG